jgi:hypothetical protein
MEWKEEMEMVTYASRNKHVVELGAVLGYFAYNPPWDTVGESKSFFHDGA